MITLCRGGENLTIYERTTAQINRILDWTESYPVETASLQEVQKLSEVLLKAAGFIMENNPEPRKVEVCFMGEAEELSM